MKLLAHTGATVGVLEWINNFIPHFMMDGNYLSMLAFEVSDVRKSSPWVSFSAVERLPFQTFCSGKMDNGRMVNMLTTAVDSEWCLLCSGPGFETTHHLIKQIAHKWHLPGLILLRGDMFSCFPYHMITKGLHFWHMNNLSIAPMLAKQPLRIGGYVSRIYALRMSQNGMNINYHVTEINWAKIPQH